MLTAGVYGIINLFDDKIYIGSAKYIKGRFSWHYRALENGYYLYVAMITSNSNN